MSLVTSQKEDESKGVLMNFVSEFIFIFSSFFLLKHLEDFFAYFIYFFPNIIFPSYSRIGIYFFEKFLISTENVKFSVN